MTDPRVSLGPDVVGTAGDNVLSALDALRPIVRVAPDVTAPAATAAAALVVLLSRVFPHTTIDGDAALGPNPWGANTVTEALSRTTGAVPTATGGPATDLILAVGDTDRPADLYVGGDDWTATVSTSPASTAAMGSGLGIHAAACFAAAEASKRALMPLGMQAVTLPADFTWNLLNHRLAPAGAVPSRRRAPVRAALLGCGSVGSSAAGVLVCVDGLTGECWPVDPDRIDPTRNPYRYPALSGTEDGPKAIWLAELLTSTGWQTSPFDGDVATWVRAQPAPGLYGMAVSSVDTVEGRRDVADLLAHTTISAGVSGLALHVQVEHPADRHACPYCDFADVRSALEEAQLRAEFTGLTEQRIIELTAGAFLTSDDVAAAVVAGRIHPERASELVGRRLDDLIRRLYAEATVPSGDTAPPAAVSAPFVSWFAGVLIAAELDKHAQGLPGLCRRLDVDLAGIPLGVTSARPRNTTGRCTCSNPARRRWARALYP